MPKQQKHFRKNYIAGRGMDIGKFKIGERVIHNKKLYIVKRHIIITKKPVIQYEIYRKGNLVYTSENKLRKYKFERR